MSNLLWGLDELTKTDASTSFLHSLTEHFKNKTLNFSRHEDYTCFLGHDTTGKYKQSTITAKCSRSSVPNGIGNSRSRPSVDDPRGKRAAKKIQVGVGLTTQRPFSTQCSGSIRKRVCRATSVPQISLEDRCIGDKGVEKKSTATRPNKYRICNDHLRTLYELENWPQVKKMFEKKSSNVMSMKERLKDIFFEFLNFFKIEKIQSPEYEENEVDCMNLYVRVNVDEIECL